jgi:hypothetical protein
MNKNIIVLLLLAFLNLKAQEKNSYIEKHQFKINILSPGITYEMGLRDNTTLCTDLNLSVGFSYNSDSGSSLLFTPYIREQYRYYYNLDARSKSGKNAKNNTVKFIAFSGSYYLKPIGNSEYVSLYDGFTLSPTWGLQRTYENGLNIGLITGVGYNFGTNDRVAGFVPVINFTLGWLIDK